MVTFYQQGYDRSILGITPSVTKRHASYPMSRSTDRAKPTTIPRTELLWLAGAIVVGVVLRLSFLNRIAIEHFDEGVYASNFWFGADQGYEYPARFLYAPPLLPAIIEWTMVLTSLLGCQPSGWIPVIPCLLAGVAAIPSLWWITRRWFGPVAGTVSAWLIATSDYHASYSRAALTDVPVCLLILWGIYFTWRALETGTVRDVLLAGFFTGLAWSTKYNGWLPLAVGLAGGTVSQFQKSASLAGLLTLARRWLAVACVSGLVWSPVLLGLQRHGGYRVVAANHHQYVGRIDDWGTTAVRQLQNIGTYDNLLSLAGMPPAQVPATQAWWSGVISPVLLLLVGLVGIATWIWQNWQRAERASSGWFVLAWICGLTVATPFYHPYPRLVLPWLTAVWVGVGVAAQLLAVRSAAATEAADPRRDLKATWCRATIATWLVATVAVRCWTGTYHSWQDRTELSRATASIATLLKSQTRDAGFSEDEAIVYVYGNPPIVFGLKSNGLSLVGPVQNLDFLRTPRVRPTFLIRTDSASSDPGFQEEWTAHESEFSRVETTPIRVSHLVRLDDQSTGQADISGGEESIEVYLVH